jgi:hypothetical protein
MADNKQLQQVQDASWDVVNSFRETSQNVADSLMSIQDHNLRFAHNIFLSWMELLTQQAESTQRSQQHWRQQIQQQQEAFQRLASNSMQIYRDFLLTPFFFSRQLVEVTETEMEHNGKESRKASR